MNETLLFDPTFVIQPEGDTPQSTATVLSSGSGMALVAFRDTTFTARIAGAASLDSGSLCSFVRFSDSSEVWVIDADGGYPSRWPRPLSEVADFNPAAAFLFQITIDNPRKFIYRPGVALASAGDSSLSVLCWDQVTRILPVEWAGDEQPSSDFSSMEQVLCYQKSEGEWVVIGVDPSTKNPIAVDDEYSTDKNTTLVIIPPGIFENDTMNASELGSYTLPIHGTLSLDLTGGFTYIPDNGYEGVDSFIYHLAKSGIDLSEATVTIYINTEPPGPVAHYIRGRIIANSIEYPFVWEWDADGNIIQGNTVEITLSNSSAVPPFPQAEVILDESSGADFTYTWDGYSSSGAGPFPCTFPIYTSGTRPFVFDNPFIWNADYRCPNSVLIIYTGVFIP